VHILVMEQWQDQGIVLAVRPHGEGGAILTLLTEMHGKHAGYVHGAKTSKMRGILEPGNIVSVNWSARVVDNLGVYKVEQVSQSSALLMNEPIKLSALLSLCGLCERALPEREVCEGLFYGFKALIEALDSELWGVSYIMWEIAFLKELGFGLDFSKCVAGGDSEKLLYMSPKSGRAVSEEKGELYKDKLLGLPDFLKPNGSNTNDIEIYKGILLTGYFLENWVFAHHSKGVPEERLRFASRFAKYVGQVNQSNEKDDALELEYAE
jgi:DNA repair protein RecO (recombination protein O)